MAAAVACSSSNEPLDSIEWAASLPLDLMFLILDKLFESTDHVRFAAVCKRWNSVAKLYYKHSPSLVPMLMILNRKSKPKQEHRKSKSKQEHREGALLYSVSEEKVYNTFQFQIPRCSDLDGMKKAEDVYYSGAGHGWLARVVLTPSDEDNNNPKPPTLLHTTLLNPFRSQPTSSSSTALPHILLSKLRYAYKWKVVLSADPALTPDDYMVILLCMGKYNSELAFLTGGGKTWTRVDDRLRFTDAIFYKGRGYGVAYGGTRVQSEVLTYDVKGSDDIPQQLGRYTLQWEHDHPGGTAYLVESTEGDLLCVRRYFKRQSCSGDKLLRTERFTVDKLVLDYKDGSVVSQFEVTSIGDNALFLGSNSRSVCVLASKHSGSRPNCIFYTNDLIRLNGWLDDNIAPLDMGIFNMEEGTITQFCPQISWDEHDLSPVWITPTFNGLSFGTS